MGLVKVTYIDGQTIISAKNLNEIQDAIIDLQNSSNNGGSAADTSYDADTGELVIDDASYNEDTGELTI